MAAKTILIMAGGTGGHVYPALAVAERLRELDARVEWLGTPQGLEGRVVPASGLPLHAIAVAGLRGKGLVSLSAAPWRLLRALIQSLAVVRRVKPDAVLGMGGFVSGPGGLAAWLSGRPLLIHEQNAVPGLTNRWLARLARVVMEAFAGSFPASRRARHTGNPLRPSVTAVPLPDLRFAARSGPLRLLVLGGSQGARALNQVVPPTLRSLAGTVAVTVWHQAGPGQLSAALESYREAGVEGRVVGFIDDMAEAYGWADLVLCRAGAMTLAELAAVGVGAILVPFPHAVDDHQSRNAAYLQRAGAAILMPQSALTVNRLTALLADLGTSRDRLLAMARAARALALPEARERVAAACLEVAHGR